MNAISPIEKTLMSQEIREIPVVMQAMLDTISEDIKEVAHKARASDPSLLVTIARGSSDHCATYLKYAFEIEAGLPVASLGPSVSSIYGKKLKLRNALALAISQSGKSPDIVDAAGMCKTAGALTFSLTNDTTSPLAGVCDHAFNISAGPEKSVAATKTFVNSLVAGLCFLAHLNEDEELVEAIRQLPEQCEAAISNRWDGLLDYMARRDSLYVLGRGPSAAIAHEMALKFKETCQIHAEAYSAAEVMHGPVSIVDEGFPILILATNDASHNSVLESIKTLEAKKAEVFPTASQKTSNNSLLVPSTVHPLTEPVLAIVSFYAFVEELSRLRGNNPDLPPNLRKVTETV